MVVQQRKIRQGVTVGDGLTDVSSVGYWWANWNIPNDEQGRGSFWLAYQQAMDGMGESIHAWMGISKEELGAWMRYGALPKRKKRA